MKKSMYVLLAVLFIGSQMTLSAQNKADRTGKQRPTQEQMIQLQSSQMVKTLMLDDATAAKFTPVYTRYLEELRACRVMNQAGRGNRPSGVRNQTTEAKPAVKPVLTDAEVEKQIKEQFAQSRKILDIREKYYNEFRKLLTPKQIAKIYQTERGNADKFKREFSQRKQGKARQGHNPAHRRQVQPAQPQQQ